MIEEKDYPLTTERQDVCSDVPSVKRTGKQLYQEHEEHVIATAIKFYACEALGSGRYNTVECNKLDDAIKAAKRLISERDPANLYSKGRPVLVYAHNGTYQVQCDLVYP